MKLQDLKDILVGITFLGLASWYVSHNILKENPQPVYSQKTRNLDRDIASVRHFDFNHNGRLDEGEIEAYRANFEEYMSTLNENLLFRINSNIRDYTEESH